MALRLDSFGLADLAAKPEDAFRLAGLAMAEGRRIPGYGGDYYYYSIGDAAVVIRTRLDPDTGEEELLGMDTHAATACQWVCRVVKDVTPEEADPLSRRVLLGRDGAEGMAVADLLCADVLPDIREGDELRLGMAGFPLRISYDEAGDGDVIEAQRDTVLLQGVVRDAKVGESYLGMEPLTKFVSVTVSTPMGDVELCHPMELVAEDQRDLVKPGTVVSALCILSGNCAVGAYAGGVVFDGDHDLAALSAFFREGGPARLRPLLHGDCVCAFLENRQEGRENALALLSVVGEDLAAAGLTRCAEGTLTGEGVRGRRCLLIGNGEGFAFLCLAELDSLGRIKELVITNDPGIEFEPVEDAGA